MSDVFMGFVGDVLVNRENPKETFSDVQEILDVPDILFGNLEGVYTDDPHPIPSAASHAISRASNLEVFSEVGFDVVSLANNHTVDAGYAALLEMQRRLRESGVATCGAGSAEDARKPAILESGGIRIAFLGYTSIFPMGCEVRGSLPGIVPIRAYSFWREPWPNLHIPGSRPLVATVPDEGDMRHLAEDIRKAKEQADLVVTSFHWGDQTRPFHLSDHERRVARYCVDNGVDLVVGHHHHAPRGMEWYRGKPIMYGLGHFVFDYLWEWSEAEEKRFKESEAGRYYKEIGYAAGPRRDWPLLGFPDDGRFTLLAWAGADRGGVREIGFVPCVLTPDGLVHPFARAGGARNDVVDYMEQCNSTQDLNGRLVDDESDRFPGMVSVRVVPN